MKERRSEEGREEGEKSLWPLLLWPSGRPIPGRSYTYNAGVMGVVWNSCRFYGQNTGLGKCSVNHLCFGPVHQ